MDLGILSLEDFIRNIPDAVFIVDDEGRMSFASARAHELLGYEPGELDGESVNVLVPEADRERHSNQIGGFYAHPSPRALNSRSGLFARRKDGSVFPADIWLNPLDTAEGVVTLAVLMDISQRKQAEESLRKSEARLQDQLKRVQALRDIDMAILGTTDLPFALQTVLAKAADLLVVDASDILLMDASSNLLEFASGWGFQTRNIEKSRLRLGEGHAGRAARGRETLGVADLHHADPPFTRGDLVLEEGFVSAYFVPLVSKGQTVGVLEIYRRSAIEEDQSWLDFLETLAGQAAIAIESGRMFHNLLRSNLDLEIAYDTTIEGWSRALDLRDKETEGHTLRVTEMTVSLARMAGIPEPEIVHVRRGALLHDIGKMGVPDHILLKPGELSEEEWERMRLHPVFAYELLHPIEYLRPALGIPHYHHERWDGTGYPDGLEGEQIPLAARLFAVVDVWDAITHDRPYRPAWPEEQAMQHIRDGAGSHFDPRAVDLFLQLVAQEGANAM